MSDFLIVVQDPAAYAAYKNVVRLPDIEDGPVLNIRTRDTDIVLPGDTLIREGGFDGSLISVNDALYAKLVAFGNSADGAATGIIQAHQFQGSPPRAIQPGGEWYPADDVPYDLEMRYVEVTGSANPAWDGWAWRVELHGDYATRDPTARAIGIYHNEQDMNAAFGSEWYTTGAFTRQQSAWQTDENGDPIEVWATEYNPAFLGEDTTEKYPVYFSLLKGSAKEGRAILEPHETGQRLLFWEHEAGYVPSPDPEWVDTGLTATQAGTVYMLSAPLPGLAVGTPIGFGADPASLGSTFSSYWNSNTSQLILAAAPLISANAKVWMFV